MRQLLCLACLCLCTCARPAHGPFFDDEKYLRFGLDPRGESNVVIEQHQASGERLARRLEGHTFSALGFVDAQGYASGVRVVTVRGIMIELDRERPSAVSEGVSYSLLPSPSEATQDADGDGFEELFIEERRLDEVCVQAYRARDTGYVERLPIVARAFGEARCPQELSDIDGDGHWELVAELKLGNGEPAPRVRVPLFTKDHRFGAEPDPEALKRFCAQERANRLQLLADARRALDVRASYRLAIELAALSKLLGETAADQLRAFDTALAGLVVDAGQSASMLGMREHIYEAWNAPEARDAGGELLNPPAR